MTAVYDEVPAHEVPKLVREGRWDVPRMNQGQIIEVAYSDGYPGRAPADVGSLFRRTIDRSDPVGTPPTYARLRRA